MRAPNGVGAAAYSSPVRAFMTVTEEQIEAEAGSREGYLNGIAKVGERLIVLLDAPGLVGALGISAHAEAA